jgi:hypothetical protein
MVRSHVETDFPHADIGPKPKLVVVVVVWIRVSHQQGCQCRASELN